MAGEKYVVRPSLALSNGVRRVLLQSEPIYVNVLGAPRIVTVPAGETRRITLSASAASFRFIALRSNVEGVAWYPVSSAGPTPTAADTPYSWLTDFTTAETVAQAGNYFHNHGDFSDVEVDHATVGTRKFYDSLPSYLSFAEDHADPKGVVPSFYSDLILSEDWAASLSGAFTPTTRAAASVGRVGNWMSIRESLSPDDTYIARKVRILLGMNGYKDLDVAGAGDEVMSFLMEAFERSVDHAGRIQVTITLWNYPFTASDLVGPAAGSLTDQGDVVWSDADVYLCPTANPGGSNLAVYLEATKNIDIDGEQNLYTESFLKSDFDAEGDATLKRVTMVDLLLTCPLAPAAENHVIIPGLQFGPDRGGVYEKLRPFAFRPGTLWSGSDAPTIDLVNDGAGAAEVEVMWGGI